MREDGAATVAIDELVARRVAAVWVPSNSFHLSLGKQDKLGETALALLGRGRGGGRTCCREAEEEAWISWGLVYAGLVSTCM